MSLFFIQASTLTNIANAIRSATGATGPIAVSAFASAVANVPSGGGSGTNLSSADRYALYNYNLGTSSNAYIVPPDTDCSRIGNIKTAFGNAEASINSVFFAELSYINDGPFTYDNYIQYVEAPNCNTIGYSAFQNCSALTSVSFPACISIGEYAFYDCSALTSISFPACTSIESGAFAYCSALTTASFPVCESVREYAFQNCNELISVWFKTETQFSDGVFEFVLSNYRTSNFELYLSGSSVGYATSNLFGSYNDLIKVGEAASSSANGSGTPSGTSDIMPIKYLSIFVPASLVSDFQENWGEGYFSANIFAWPT